MLRSGLRSDAPTWHSEVAHKGVHGWRRTVLPLLLAGFEAFCVLCYLELVYDLLDFSIHKDGQVMC